MTGTPTPGFDLAKMRKVAEAFSRASTSTDSWFDWLEEVNPASVLALISAYETSREEIEDMRASLDKISAEIYSTRAAYEAEKERADRAETAERERDEARKDCEVAETMYAEERQRTKHALALIARAVEVVEWYAEKGAGCRKVTSEGDAARRALDNDGGSRARALAADLRKAGEGQ